MRTRHRAAMPFSVEVDSDARVAYIRSWGHFGAWGRLRVPLDPARAPEWEPDFGVVFDLRDLIHEPLPADVVEMTRGLLSRNAPDLPRIGVVVSRDLKRSEELASAIAGCEDAPIRFFDTLDAAFAWVRRRSGGSST